MIKRITWLALLILLLCASPGFAEYASELLTEENDWSDSLVIPRGDRVNINIVPNSNSNLTVTVQLKYAEEVSWGHEVNTYVITGSTAEIVDTTQQPEQEAYVYYRIGCATGDYAAGNATVRIGH